MAKKPSLDEKLTRIHAKYLADTEDAYKRREAALGEATRAYSAALSAANSAYKEETAGAWEVFVRESELARMAAGAET